MSIRRWVQVAAIMIPVGVLSVSLGARSMSTFELTTGSVRVDIPESAELFAAGTILVGMAASAERATRRRAE